MTDEQLFKNLFAYSPTPTAVFHRDGSLRLANRAFHAQLGAVEGVPAGDIALGDLFVDREVVREFLQQIDARGVVRRLEAHLRMTDAGDLFALVSGRALLIDGQPCLELSFQNIGYLKKHEQTLRRKYTRLSSLIENLTGGVFLVNNRNVITNTNLALGNFLQSSPEAFISGSYRHLFAHLISLAAQPDLLQRELSGAVLRVSEKPVVEFILKDNELQYLELSLFPVRDDTGRPLGWGGLFSDITEMRVQAAWKLELLATLSHDLRSPLATLKGHATALLANYDQWNPDMVNEFLESIDSGVDRLTHLVDRNLALTRVETGRLGLRPESVRPEQLVHNALERAAGRLEQVRVLLEFEEELPDIRVDPGRVEEVLVNLLDNAARYTPADSPITVRLQAEDDRVIFFVMDLGPGIPLERQPAIFEKYTRPEAEGGGTGLGLFISRKIVESHGGQIRVESPVTGNRRGSAFAFSLPTSPRITAQPAGEKRVPDFLPEKEEQVGQRILIVDDEPDYQALLRTILNAEGYETIAAPDGETALDIIRISTPDVVLLDWSLPGMNGLQVCRSLRRWSSVPVVLLAARTAQEDLIAAFDVGADDYITKPFQSDELLVRIRALLRRSPETDDQGSANSFHERGLLIDFDTREVWRNGEKVDLTATEYDLLAYFAESPRRVLTYGQVIEHLWPDGEGTRHGLFVHLSRLRKKIERDSQAKPLIDTRRGIGYIFMP